MNPIPVLAVAFGTACLAASFVGSTAAESGAGEHFLAADRCAVCHSASPTAQALWSATGDDVSPHGLWQATMMANSFRDPYWRAQVSKEVEANPQQRAEIEALCLTCHGPAAHHQARFDGRDSPGVVGSYDDPMAQDGVTCTVCHQAEAAGLGDPSSFSGRLTIGTDKRIYGPYPDPSFRPMLMHTGFTATHGPQMQDSALCGSCHTLFTHHVEGGAGFAEQTPYLEWRNSKYSDEDGPLETSRSCQDCHMPELGPMRIARNPAGFDFNIPVRDSFRGHTFVGGNAFMLDLLAANAEELGVTASPAALARNAKATRRTLAQQTAELAIEGLEVVAGRAEFVVRVVNRAGHKLPTGYPARRAWLRVQVRQGRETVFESGTVDSAGRIRGLADARRSPHHQRIETPEQVQIYEAVPVDVDGEPTTYLTRMARMGKDNRLLPSGWRADGPHAEETRPVGTDDDPDFVGGADRVQYSVELTTDTAGDLVVVAWLLYQPVPPAWVDPLRSVDSDEARRFVRMYDAADKRPETLAVTVAVTR